MEGKERNFIVTSEKKKENHCTTSVPSLFRIYSEGDSLNTTLSSV